MEVDWSNLYGAKPPQLICITFGNDRRDARNVDCGWCDVCQRSMPRMTLYIQIASNCRKHFATAKKSCSVDGCGKWCKSMLPPLPSIAVQNPENHLVPFEGPVGVWWSSCNWPTKFGKKGPQVHKAVFCTGYGGHLQNKPLLTRKHWNTSASHIFCNTYFRFWKCFRTNNVEKYSHTLQRAVNLTFTVQWDKDACWALGCFVRCCNGLLVDGECVWEQPGVDLEDGGGPSVDLRFADDILVFATSLLAWWTCGCIGTRRFDFERRQNAVANDNNDTETFFATRPCPWGNACSFWENC